MDAPERPAVQETVDANTHVRPSIAPFIAYLALLYGCWTGWVVLLYRPLQALGSATVAYALANIASRLVIWVIPVFLYLRLIDRGDPLAYLKLRHAWRRGLVVGLVLSALNILATVLRHGPPHLSMQYVTWNSILSTSLLIGVVEEIPFRGFIFQKLHERTRWWIANLLSSLLFVGIHLPGWLLLSTFSWYDAVSVLVIGAILTVIFALTRSLWSSIVVHSLNDFVSAVLFHVS